MGKEDVEKAKDSDTFVVKIQHQQNSTWQGEVTWVEQDKKVHFRSGLELIKLIDEAIKKDAE